MLHATEAPLFVLDGGRGAAAQVSDVWYHDGCRSKTLADMVLDTHAGRQSEATPTHREYDVERVEWVGFTLYQDESTFTDADGETRHVRFSAALLYADGELAGVVEYAEDRTTEVRRGEDLKRLVSDLVETMGAADLRPGSGGSRGR